MQREAAAPQHSKPLWSAASLQNSDYFLEYLARPELPDIRQKTYRQLQWTKPPKEGPSSNPRREGTAPPSTLGIFNVLLCKFALCATFNRNELHLVSYFRWYIFFYVMWSIQRWNWVWLDLEFTISACAKCFRSCNFLLVDQQLLSCASKLHGRYTSS